MGKEKPGFLSPKAIGNRIKSKGLQKLRWYCQMCQKQCRDENGFKCHMSSESHQRQLLLFAENPNKILDSFSKEFEEGYLELLKRRFGTKRVNGNIVYQEYIAFKEHVHMNATEWETLTDFVKHLGKEGLCIVDDTEKGWYVTYIDRDPETIRRQEAVKAKEKMDVDDEDRTMKFIDKQIRRAGGAVKDTAEYTEFNREDEEEKITFSLGATKKPDLITMKNPVLPSKPSSSDKTEEKEKSKSSPASSSRAEKRKHKSALGEIMEAEEKKKEKQNRKDYWLTPGIVVKVIHKRLGDKYYKKKAYVRMMQPQDCYAAVITMLESGDRLKVDQTHVETVIPGIGKQVLIVNGAYRGGVAVLQALDAKKFCCSLKINKGLLKGRIVDGIPYEDFSKLHQESYDFWRSTHADDLHK